MKREGEGEDEKTQWEDILKEYMRMQFQAASLNEHFAALTAQENSLKILHESLQSELFSYISTNEDPNSLKQTVQQRMELLFPDNPTFSSMKLTLNSTEAEQLLETEVTKAEKFCLAIISNCQETWQRVGSYLSFVGKQVGGLEDRIQLAISDNKPAFITEQDKRKGKKELSEGKKGDPLMVSSLTVLRDALYELYPERVKSIADILSRGSKIIAVRIYASSVSQKEAVEGFRSIPNPESDKKKFTTQVLNWLIQAGDEVVRAQAVHVFQCIQNLLISMQITREELEKEMGNVPMSEEQRRQAEAERRKLARTADGPPLMDLPEKLVEQLTKTFDRKVKALASYQPRGLTLDPLPSTYRPAANYDQSTDTAEKLPSSKRISSSDQEAEERVSTTQALLKHERDIMRLGVSPRLNSIQSDGKLQKISLLTSIKRGADLEKKLLEQVQDIEFKLKRIKSRGESHLERKLLGKTSSIRLPPLIKSSTTSSLEVQKGSFRSVKLLQTDRP